MKVVMYPGSFDPVTNGHINLIHRGLNLFDQMIVAVAHNARKTALFNPQERMEMIRDSIGDQPRVEVTTFEGLLVDYAQKRKVSAVMRGLRAMSDFEFEFQLAHMNRRLAPQLEAVFMMTSEEHFYVSSSLVREIAQFGGNLAGLVPTQVEARLKERFRR
ncbi:MAG: pantetheine-phosphate adenylyltransferase [Clostridia bacterium]|nr:pantetheine-phosphate adenylyltransferase [Deltaproteobacteria bacterium]